MAHQKVSAQSMDTHDLQADSSESINNETVGSPCNVTESCIDKLAIKEDTSNYCRIILLMVDVGTETLRYLFYQNIQKDEVKNYFASKKPEIDKKKLFDKTQYTKLFCPNPNPDEYDISLLIKLLLNFNFGSSAVDLERLRDIRNEIVGHNSKAVLTNQVFENLWSEVKAILLRIAKSISTDIEEDINVKIEDLKHKLFEISDREMKIIKAFEAQYEENIVTLHENILTLNEDVSMLQTRVAYLHGRVLHGDRLNLHEDKDNISLEVKSSQHLALTQDMLNGCCTKVINLYRTYEAHHPLSPWHGQYNAVLTEMYVNPPMCCIEYNDLKKSKETTPVKSFRDIFYKHSKRCSNIFIKSLPGAGKTTLCKWMKLMWCQAHKPIAEYNTVFAEEDLAIMKEFDFLFHVPLRNFTQRDYYIDDMIQEEILNFIDQIEANVLQDILNTQKCLVVLDGLDEYAPSNPNLFRDQLPHLRKPRKLCVVITTRPWKFYDLQLKDYQVDQLVEITKFGNFETDILIGKVIRCLNEKSEQNRKLEDFRTELQKCMRQDIVSIPILLMQLVCLWYEDKPLGRSHCETYTNMLELLFHRSATLKQLTVEHHQLDFQIPNCLSQEAEHCRNSMKLLHHLGHLAFDTLFNTCQESSLVFEASLAKKHLSDEEMSICLKIGILSQNKVTGLISNRCTVEFLHKTFQEFLSAFYISTCNGDEHFKLMQLVIPSNCSMQKILETSEILIFLSGLCPSVVSKISINIGQIVHSNDLVRVHRESLIDYVLPLNEKMDSLKDHQLNILGDLFINCVTESRANNCEIPDIPIKDLFYCGNEDSHHVASLQYLIDHCAHNVKSLCVQSESKTLQKLNLDNLNKLECLSVWFKDEYLVIIPEEKTTALTKSVPTLIQLGLKGASVDGKFVYVLQSCQYLQSVELVAVDLAHKHMEKLMLFLSQKTDLKEISLRSVNCTEHPIDYKALSEAQSAYKNPDCLHKLNLTKHKLVHLKLVYMGFSDLSVNTYELQYCLLGGLSNVAVSTLLGDPSNLQNLSDLSCQYMWSSETIQCILTTVSTLVNLVYIFFCNVNIGNKFVMSSKMTNLKRVALHRVSVNISTLYQLLNSLTLIKHKILVEVYDCEISPQGDTDIFKDEIRNSQRYIVCRDCVDLNGYDLFLFYTNPYILPSPWQEEQDIILTDTIFHLNHEKNLDKKTAECKMELKKLMRQDLVTIPKILKLLINLWYDNKPLGHSQCEMYANILELLFHRYGTLGQLTVGQVSVKHVKLPNCFSQNCVYCRIFVKLLHKLGHMAFDALFNSHQERTLVFTESLAKKYLSRKQLKKCFKIGILLKSKVTGLKSSQHTYEFLHQTLQEFLSTLYICMSQADEQLKFVRDCQLEHMLKNSEILIFFSGVCPSLVSQIFRIKEISSNSWLTQKHRESLGHYLMPLNFKTENFNDHPLKVFQDVLVNCAAESRSNNCEVPYIPVQDVFYFSNEDSHYITSIQYLLDHSAHSVQSLCIQSDKDALQKVHLKNLNNLKCLYVHITDDPIVHLSEEMTIVWKTAMPNLKQFGLRSAIVEDVSVQAMQQCQSFELFNVNLAHKPIEDLMLFLSQMTGLKELSLGHIKCTDHKKFDCLDRLDLTYCQLKHLRLNNVVVRDINIKSDKLKYCQLLGVCHAAISGVLGTPMLLPALEYLTCGSIQSSNTSEFIVTALSSLVNLNYINLIEMDVRDKQFVFTENKKCVQFNLFKVLVSISTLRELVNSLEHINGHIYIILCNCKMYPPDDVGMFKQEIQERFCVINDGVNDNGYDEFSFIT